ncbi:Protein-export protein SecB [Oligella sp. MSHR50489EDL]|uniref:protein-export chaperone SecB n=1 Tax=Oligella sp. MSHR50489EDL TaxID=3139409 RepID=UPI003D817A50
MAEEQNTQNQDAAAQQAQQPSFGIQRSYLKDLSLEMPHAPHIFLEQEQPSVEISLNVGAEQLAETIFEATVRATITTKINDKILYLVEGTQAGIFEIDNIPADQVDPLLGIVCPSMIFPYLRANLADAINRTGLPSIHMAEVNFQALYEQRLQEAAAGAGAGAGGEATNDSNPTIN